MEYINHIAIILIIAAAYFSVKISTKLIKLPEEVGHFESIDGVRGYLGIIVYLHHACTWYYYLKSNKWEFTPIDFYTTLGQGSMVFIFMVTGFLFFGKIIDSRENKINWNKFIYFRLFRLIPMYATAIGLMILIIMASSNWQLKEGIGSILKECANWMFFTILSAPNINEFRDTSLVVAGVTWTMPYEWCYYLILPAISFMYSQKVPKKYLLLSAISVAYALLQNLHWAAGLSFIGGMLSAKLSRIDKIKAFSVSNGASALMIILTIILARFFKTSYAAIPIGILSLIFLIIASGNTLFGMLSSITARRIGQIAYSIYLLHGITLYLIFTIILDKSFSSTLDIKQHWLMVLAATPVLMLASTATYRWIEHPSMQIAKRMY